MCMKTILILFVSSSALFTTTEANGWTNLTCNAMCLTHAAGYGWCRGGGSWNSASSETWLSATCTDLQAYPSDGMFASGWCECLRPNYS